jgi:hypothetical protein
MFSSFRRLALLIPVPGLLLAVALRPAGSAPIPPVPPSAVSAERLEVLSRAYLGTPYKLDCLGEGKGPDPDPLYTRDYVDCQTYLEQVFAEALAPHLGGLDPAVRRIRYHHGEVGLENRYHYCVPDWLRNPWPVKDVTGQVAGTSALAVRRRIDRPTFLASRGGSAAKAPKGPETVTASYIPMKGIAAVETRIPHGSVGVFVLSKPGIVAGHVGFLFRKEGKLFFRHASQTAKKVIDEPLQGYVTRAPKKFIGMMVLQPDASGLRR